METSGNIGKPIISDTLFISLLSAFGYITAYCYESGYCGYFNIPSELIEISITKVITVTLVMFGALLTLGHFASPFVGLVSSENIAKRMIGKYVFIMMFLGIAYWSSNEFYTLVYALIITVTYFYFDIIHPILSKRDIIGYVNKLKAHHIDFSAEKERSIWFNDRMGRLLNREYAILIVAGLTALLIASGLGRSQAKNQKYFLATKSPNQILILRQYGSSLIGAGIDQNSMIMNGIHLIEKSNLKDYGPLIFQKTGTIKPNPSMKPSNK